MTDSEALLDIPVIVGDLVTLRPHTVADADGVLERAVDPLAQRFTTVPLAYTRDMAVDYVTVFTAPSAAQISWAIEVQGRYAGTIDLRVMPVDAGAGSLGFATHPDFRGRGVMSEAVRLVVAHAFDSLGWQTVSWEAHAGNWGSAKAVWRAGFPVPTFVPDLLVERGRLVDGWISTVHAPAPAGPVTSWEQVQAALSR
ncbi:RimJ/RimL family protein N-acetyltransferase [Phycicoccus badiiscoriae]|uniref:RimJ/RimL family protein N-acetyltransferase n=1 Tax=Pedococcus badiiscoriae TaxID=642776 RepID=A0A852WKD5_9MICO|nr:GNAT family N-acetyltransferase [Pedococcus badiiscoriae]NYG07164.1 RimJ/RimL family protein N-acetyltransferase [Pedococcus badiiscoriae]